jgi:DNA-binding CsgD family transcriptional regulator
MKRPPRNRGEHHHNRHHAAERAFDAVGPPPGFSVDTIEVAGELLVVFSFPTSQTARDALTDAEQSIVEFTLQGYRTAEIAILRGVAVPTVSAQLQSAYRKLQVTSRIELVSKLERG